MCAASLQCGFRCPDRLKLVLQGFSPVWIFWCCLSAVVKVSEQVLTRDFEQFSYSSLTFISHWLGPKYMSDMLTEYKPNRPLRSLGSSQLEIPRVHTKQGESAFSYYAARSWNQLPEEIRCAKTLATFKSGLKTHLFSCAFVE